jgi:two-component system, cell cycle response regulator
MESNEHHLPRLLAIDDSGLIHRLLKSRLRHERVEIHRAMSGEEGLNLARALLPEVILLDIEMPHMDGFEVLRELKADSRTHDIPVIFVSGSSDTENKVRGLEMGAIDFITKPFDIAELKARLRSAVRIRLLIRMLAQRAQLDGLTGLWNRAYFNDRLGQELADARRHGTPLSLVMADLDEFKQLNDRYGHPFGDLVLEEFSRILGGSRGGDVPCRFGGEEFAIIVPHAAAYESVMMAERVRQSLGETKWDGHPHLVVTASFGVTDLEHAAEPTAKAMIDSADQALYAAKEAGRNCVFAAPPRQRTARRSA